MPLESVVIAYYSFPLSQCSSRDSEEFRCSAEVFHEAPVRRLMAWVKTSPGMQDPRGSPQPSMASEAIWVLQSVLPFWERPPLLSWGHSLPFSYQTPCLSFILIPLKDGSYWNILWWCSEKWLVQAPWSRGTFLSKAAEGSPFRWGCDDGRGCWDFGYSYSATGPGCPSEMKGAL